MHNKPGQQQLTSAQYLYACAHEHANMVLYIYTSDIPGCRLRKLPYDCQQAQIFHQYERMFDRH